ncbi:MAG: 16S rRNA (adenine(1518)-N(6)/adenine(1519)-N(6))-dimethyltransferase RsmA [Rhodospirillales bacterium]
MTVRLDDLPPIREQLAMHGLLARKSFGQHFLLDLNLTGRIARAAGDLQQGSCIEIGPGPGGLTRALLAAGAADVVVVEKDLRFRPILEDVGACCPGRLQIIEGDALKTATHELGAAPRRVIANLPYNISTPLLIGWLRHIDRFDSLTLMFQKEVAQRIAAPPGSGNYGRLSVMTQWLCHTEILFDVPARAFTPPPKVDSAIIQLHPKDNPPDAETFLKMEQTVARAFNQRRKMVRSSLKGYDLDAAGIDPTARAEQLTVDDFLRLSRTAG